MVFEVTILGSSAAMPGWGRNLAAQLVNYEQQLFLVDCGEGTQHQLLRYRVRLGRIRHILISHLHGDHYLGLPGLLSTMQLLGRTEPLHLHAPTDLAEWLTGQFRLSQAYLAYPLLFYPLPAPGGAPVHVGDTLVVTTLPTDHRIEGYGFLFREKDRLRKIIKEMLPPDLPIEGIQALKRGLDVAHHGQLLRHDDHTTPPLPPLAYAYCSDTKFSPGLAPWVAGVDLLYHEATFADDFAARAQETYHSTARQAAELAQLAGAKKLLLGHFSVRYRDLSPLLDQAREVFANAHLAIEGQTFSVNGQLTSQI